MGSASQRPGSEGVLMDIDPVDAAMGTVGVASESLATGVSHTTTIHNPNSGGVWHEKWGALPEIEVQGSVIDELTAPRFPTPPDGDESAASTDDIEF